MTVSSGQTALRPKRRGLLARIVAQRDDYFYVLPALIVMMIVIAYPIYYTIELSF
jgi:multiple sugar transport system permease protein